MSTAFTLIDYILIAVSVLLFIVTAFALYLLRKVRNNSAIKYEFVTIIAHKFRTPLSSTRWSLGELIPSEPDPFRQNSLKDIQKSNQQLMDLTNTLIELADNDKNVQTSYNFEQAPLGDLVRNAVNAMQTQFGEKNISVSVTEAEKPTVSVDKARLEFVLHNILQNSCIYTPAGGNVTITVGVMKGKAAAVFTDNGIGIEESELRNVFSEFHRTADAQKFDTEGLGVGLYLSKSIMRRLHGTIEVFSAGKDQGSTFVVSLPIAR